MPDARMVLNVDLDERSREALIANEIGRLSITGDGIQNYPITVSLKHPMISADRIAHVRDWSRETFGPGARTEGVIDHIRKECNEVLAHPEDITEWADLIILAIDGAWRAGHEPQDIIDAVIAKWAKNESRTWPDWRTADPNKAIEHDRSFDE